MDYYKVFSTLSARNEAFEDLDFTLLNYVLYTVRGSDDRHHQHKQYFIEFQNNKGIGACLISFKEVWEALKDYIQIGANVKCDGVFLYDENDNLYGIQISSFKYNDICVSREKIITPKGNVRTTRGLSEDKLLLALFLGFFIFLFLTFYSQIFLLLFLFDIVSLGIYASIKNKKMGKVVCSKLEEMGLQKRAQDYVKKSNVKNLF